MATTFEDLMDPFGELAGDMNEAMYGDRRPRGRVNVRHTDSNGKEAIIGLSIPHGATQEELEAIVASVKDASEQIAAFDRLSEVEQLQHYLRNAYKTLSEISKMCQVKLDDHFSALHDNELAAGEYRKLDKLRGDIFCKADFACLEIPSRYGRGSQGIND